MASLGMEVIGGFAPAVRFWAASMDNVADPAVFLVRSGRAKMLSRVCLLSDLDGWPDADTPGFGWFRSSGVEYPLDSGAELVRLKRLIGEGLEALDATAGEVAEAEAVLTEESLRFGGTGQEFGVLQVSRKLAGDAALLDFSILVSNAALLELLPFGLFVLSGGELLRVLEPADGFDASMLGSAESLDMAFGTAVRAELAPALVAALAMDIESFCTCAAAAGGLNLE